ncbi:MAG: response regulator [Ignavibacteria bacterium]|nr:response regulator [Ignavibacteria bacterium]
MAKAEILIVEDDKLSASVLRRILGKNNYNVVGILENGEDAVKTALELKPDLILMDIFLKDKIDGIEAAGKIKENYDIPVIYLTADSSLDTIQRAKITEPFGYLVKPVESSSLITNIELSLQKQSSYNKKLLEILKKANDELENRVKQRTEELMKLNEDLKNEMKQRMNAEDELRKADKLATIGRMSAILAHEIRNPLNSIKINTDIMIENSELTSNIKKRLKIIQKEVDRLSNLVKDVLAFSRQGELVIGDIHLDNFFDNLSQQLASLLDAKRIILSVKVEKQLVIKGDIEKLRQVFLNLLINAMDAIYENGEIIINSEIDKKRNRLILNICDNGTGVVEIVKIFEPFHTTKSSGTGLGLSISQNIIRQHGGNLFLKSAMPGKTVFCVELPFH